MPEILFEDNKILVVVKPPGLLSQSDFTGRPDMLTILKEYIKEKYHKPGNVFLGLVHRLDKEVGGVMVFAKNSKTARFLSEQIREHKFNKYYLAQIQNWNLPPEGQLEDFLIKDSFKNITRFGKENDPEAKKAILNYKVIKQEKGRAIIEVQLITGRSHQIRAQFGLRGMPLVGDQKYGATEAGTTIGLWAYKLAFINPQDKKTLAKFNSEPIWENNHIHLPL